MKCAGVPRLSIVVKKMKENTKAIIMVSFYLGRIFKNYFTPLLHYCTNISSACVLCPFATAATRPIVGIAP